MKLKWCDKYDSKQTRYETNNSQVWQISRIILIKKNRRTKPVTLQRIDGQRHTKWCFIQFALFWIHLEDSLNKNLQVDWKWYFLVKSLRLFPNINHKMAIWVKRGGPLKCVYIYEILTLYLVKILCVYWNSRAELFILKMLGIKNWKTPYTLV